MARIKKTENVPKDMQNTFNMVVKFTDEFSKQHLNSEYAQLARYVTAALCRKRQSPLMNGYANIWACGIVYALGYVNFLFDKSQIPYINATDLCNYFSVGKSTASTKSKLVRDALKMIPLDPNWCLPSKMDDNPLAWTIIYNGFSVDVRCLPRNIQELAYKKGIIPYMPPDRE